jgi:hypothetical protein
MNDKHSKNCINYAKRGKKLFVSIALLSLLLLSSTSCGLSSDRSLVRLPEDEYEEAAYSMSYVQRGDISYDIEEEMQLDNYVETNYGFTEKKMDSTMLEDIEFDRLYVMVGDTVHPGDILLQLKSQSLQDNIDKYTEQKEVAEIEIKHINNRIAINPDEDHSAELNKYEEDIRVAEGYLEELAVKKEALCVRSEVEGKVIKISDSALSGMMKATSDLVTVASGDDTYYVNTKESTTLKEGDTVKASNGIVQYDVKVEKIDRSSAGSKIYFKIVGSEDELTIVKGLMVPVASEVRTDVLYVSKDCVKEKNEHYYAFLLDEHGARIAREIKIDSTIGDEVIIQEGLSEGDEVIAKKN